ncbi:DUF5696 domain-containing protein [Treponema bryantii]|uniref:DUF5696 domain-containing protein n=1 Tax=Treponema bryantii TaxID=163 RepID=UPI002B30405E|nr:hypothetical protein TRBR_20650 [Treponema bryantii]
MEKEKKVKEPKAPKAPKVKKSKYPEGYIGRPKPMKTKTFEFHKPTAKFWVGFGFTLAVIGFLTYIVIRLIQVGNAVQPPLEYYEAEKIADTYTLENNYLKFEMNGKTTTFTVLQKNTGKVWYSNPQGAKTDKLALVKEKNNMMSTLLVKYSTENGSDDTYDTYTNSVQRNFYNIVKKGNEITVNYTVGQMDREYIFPLIMYQDEFDKWTEGLTKSQTSAVGRAYHKYNKSSFKGSELSDMLEKYPGMEDQNLYLVFENVQTHVKVQMEELFAKQGFTYEDYLKNKELYKESNIKEVPAFNVSITYKLDGNNLVVNVPFNEISYRLKYPITQLSVLPYFGAAGPDDEGYMLIPEGGGSIINFNNGKTKQNGYYADCYGWDYAMERKAVITETRAAYPVFGISYPDSSVLSVIEKGAEYAGITAEIAGKLGSYNYIRADYKMLHREQYEVTARSQSAQFVYEAQLPQEEYIQQAFTFVDSGSYVDMAKAYRNKLFAGAKKQNVQNVPVAVEIVGAIEKKQQIAGMPKVRPYKLTSYKDAGKIINEIDELGIKDVNYKLSGFVNGGIRQKFMNKINFIKVLGGKSDFKKMLKSVEETSGKLYLDGAVQTAYRSNIFDGFFSYRDAARFVSDELCELSEYTPIWYGKDPERDNYYLLNNKNRIKGAEKFLKSASKMKLDGVSFRDNGNLLSSDFNDRALLTRAQETANQIAKFDEAAEKGLAIMINGGNDYAVTKADFVTNMPLHGNQYAIIDGIVPFYQIALHGYVNYAGSPINLAYEKDQILLESAEAGAGLQFSFINASERDLQETNYTEYYASNFDEWKEKLSEVYEEYNSKMSPVMNSLIKNHEYVSDNVTKTTYENGYVVYVNFSYKNYITPSGKFIPEREYRVMKVED